jgi:hypothetical protein
MSTTNGHPHPLEHEDDRAVSPQHAAIQALATMQTQTDHTHQLVRELRQMVADQTAPADLDEIVLTTATPRVELEARNPFASLGILNPTAADIYVGVNGSARVGSRVPMCPAVSLLVLPISIQLVEFGVDPAFPAANGDVVLYVFRYRSVQPAFLGQAAV